MVTRAKIMGDLEEGQGRIKNPKKNPKANPLMYMSMIMKTIMTM